MRVFFFFFEWPMIISFLADPANLFFFFLRLPPPHTWWSCGWFTRSAPGLFLWKQIYECGSVFAVRQSDYSSKCVSSETGVHHGECQQHIIIRRHLTRSVYVSVYYSRCEDVNVFYTAAPWGPAPLLGTKKLVPLHNISVMTLVNVMVRLGLGK